MCPLPDSPSTSAAPHIHALTPRTGRSSRSTSWAAAPRRSMAPQSPALCCPTWRTACAAAGSLPRITTTSAHSMRATTPSRSCTWRAQWEALTTSRCGCVDVWRGEGRGRRRCYGQCINSSARPSIDPSIRGEQRGIRAEQCIKNSYGLVHGQSPRIKLQCGGQPDMTGHKGAIVPISTSTKSIRVSTLRNRGLGRTWGPQEHDVGCRPVGWEARMTPGNDPQHAVAKG
eukprot:358316-Chlamydomonas_euryale.AAC.2